MPSVKNLFFFLIICVFSLHGQQPAPLIMIKGQWFLAYQNGGRSENEYSSFNLKRGYLTAQREFGSNFSGRITYDITVDREGDGEGDVELRIKYLYLKYKLDGFFFFSHPYTEFGLIHRPWIDFEQGINRYRVQGTMFLERNDVINSADYGLTFVSLLGGKLDSAFVQNVSRNFPGKYGSIALGIYNGGGYHALEKNNDKTFESRLTLRPLPEMMKGLQISYAGAYGKGNAETSPDWIMHAGLLSLESERLAMTAMYLQGTGNYGGDAADSTGNAYDQKGYSFFTEYRITGTDISLFGRYDHFTSMLPSGRDVSRRYIAGIAYEFITGGKILFDYDRVRHVNVDDRYEVAVELYY